jgi:Asp-tRNA(Asn)/Glu-tRNA(Gln) amidotransferase A subunit family amidase
MRRKRTWPIGVKTVKRSIKPSSLGVRGIVAEIEAGRLTASAVAESYLEAIAGREGEVHAFAFLDPALVTAQARRLDRAGRRRALPLRGVPFAVKDIIKTRDQPTECNSPIYRGYRPKADADCVAAVREAGALIIGKTVTTEFAGRHPGPTRNPRNLARTPGGSSSGSAAAVAAGFAPLAFGTQTGGSVIRPASYCGIVGYKSTLGGLSVGGIKPLALGFDALGVMAATPDDILVAHAVLAGVDDRSPKPSRKPRFGLVKTPAWQLADAASRNAVSRTAARLRALGASVEAVKLPADFDDIIAVQETVSTHIIADSYRWEWEHHRDKLSSSFRQTIEMGLAWPHETLASAWATAHTCLDLMNAILARYDALLTPAALGEAGIGIAETGSAACNAMWSLLGPPAVTLPLARGPAGMPIGVQLVAARRDDRRLLGLADWVFKKLGPA